MESAAMQKNKAGITKILRGIWKQRWLMGMLLIGLIWYAIFCYGPMYGVQIAFRDYQFRKGIWGSEWVGLANFRRMLNTRAFSDVFKNTVIISSLKLVCGFPAPIILALLLNELRGVIFKRTVQTISYLPHFLSWVVLGGVFKQLLSVNNGVVNYVLGLIDVGPIFFLGDNAWFRQTLVITSIWKGIGWGTIIYLATISTINPELYEASVIDGANRFKQVLHITIPSILPVISIQLILSASSIIGDDFDQIFNLYNDAVYRTGDVLSTYVYRQGLIDMKYSYTAAVGLFRNVIGFAMVIIVNYVTSKFSEYGIW